MDANQLEQEDAGATMYMGISWCYSNNDRELPATCNGPIIEGTSAWEPAQPDFAQPDIFLASLTPDAHIMDAFTEPSGIRSGSGEIGRGGIGKAYNCTSSSPFTPTTCNHPLERSSCRAENLWPAHLSRPSTEVKETRRKRSSRPLQRKPMRSVPKPVIANKPPSPPEGTPTHPPAGHASGDEAEPKVLFACPFWRKDPSQNMDCLNLRLTRSRDVKQHLQRRHYESQLSCPTCGKDFSSNVDYREHIIARQCVLSRPVPGVTVQRVPVSAQEDLKKAPSRTLTQEEQWYAIWRLLFPNVQPPENPYLDTVLGEGVGIVQRFWDKEGSDFSARFLEKNRTSQTSARDLNLLVTQLLGHLQQRIGNNRSEGGQECDMLALEEAVSDTPDSNFSSSSSSSSSSTELKMSSSMIGAEYAGPDLFPISDPVSLWSSKPLSPYLVVQEPAELDAMESFDCEPGWQDIAGFAVFPSTETGGQC